MKNTRITLKLINKHNYDSTINLTSSSGGLTSITTFLLLSF